MASSALSPQDLDAATRTVLSEAAPGDLNGQLAVASTIANRMVAGGYGNSPAAIVTAPNQYEVWQNGRAQAQDPRSPAYRIASQIVQDAMSGAAPDPTGGATHFFSPSGQASLGRSVPSWAGTPLASIGGNVFFAPKGAVVRKQQQQQDAGGPDVDGLLSAWGVGGVSGQHGSATAAAPAPAASPAAQGAEPDVDGLLSAWGANPASTMPNAGAAVPAGSTDTAPPLTIRPATTATPAAQSQPQASGAAPTNSATATAIARTVGGVPLIGPYALGGLERLSALQRAQDNGTPFDQELATVQAADAARVKDHPNAALAGDIAGNLLGYGALGATSLGARALGLTGDNLLMRAATGGVTNAAIGAGDAAIRSGGDPSSTGFGAASGLVAGAAGPFVSRAVEMGANRLLPYLDRFRPGDTAPNALLQAIQGTGGDLSDIAARMQANPRLALMDANLGARNIAQGLAAQPGDARDTLVRAYADRTGGAQDAVQSAYDTAMGPTPDVLATLDGIKQTAATNARQGFGAALGNAGPVDLSATIQALDDQIRPGVGKVLSVDSGIPLSPIQQRLGQIKAMLTDGSSVLTDPARLHQIQSALRVEGDTLLNSSTGSDRLMGRAVMGARDNIVGAIDDATGGTFRPAQKQYADDMSIHDAFEKGLSIFSNRSGVNGLEDRPEYWQAFVNDASPGELDALRLGARTAVDQQMGSVRNATRKGAAIPEVGFNRAKLEAVLGEDETDQLARRLADEQDIGRTNNMLFEGSQTQPRQQAAAATAVRDIGPLAMDISLPSFAYMTGNPLTAATLGGAAIARRGLQYAGQRADLARNALQAQMVSGSGMSGQAVLNRLMMAANAPPSSLPVLARGSGNALSLGMASAPLDRNRLFEAAQRR